MIKLLFGFYIITIGLMFLKIIIDFAIIYPFLVIFVPFCFMLILVGSIEIGEKL